ncbi:hypothetical protein [Streptomyces wuyuanensis]|uniref:hypothetical protein n=1 Tax=Streptomyces wuyuanensis TaxID=1196353 RepID=UPI0037B2F5D4
MSSRPRRRDWPPQVEELPPPADLAHDGALQITETDCERCGTRLSGLNGRYRVYSQCTGPSARW